MGQDIKQRILLIVQFAPSLVRIVKKLRAESDGRLTLVPTNLSNRYAIGKTVSRREELIFLWNACEKGRREPLRSRSIRKSSDDWETFGAGGPLIILSPTQL